MHLYPKAHSKDSIEMRETGFCQTHRTTYLLELGCSRCEASTRLFKEAQAKAESNRVTCKHESTYNILGGSTRYCPNCNSMEVSEWVYKATGERFPRQTMGAIDSRDPEVVAGLVTTASKWIPSGGRAETYSQFVKRQSAISRAFGERYYPEYDGN